jgi:glyoxylase-like metal-dependent hydrolase (beta-lactamase superfamily II)
MFTVGALFTNCYLVWCEKTKEAIIIDPGFDSETEAMKILKKAEREGLHIKYIVNTHGHPDHVSGNIHAKNFTGAPILIHELDAPLLSKNDAAVMFGLRIKPIEADKTLRDGDPIKFGQVLLRVLHTPGHSPGSISLLGDNAVFTGDTLFAGSIGRTDFPGSSYKAIMRSLKERLATLPDNFVVYPGHGPSSTIGEEKRSNPFLQPNAESLFSEIEEY